ncbi:hypothetical protein D3C71_2145130 [compost metagenome]
MASAPTSLIPLASLCAAALASLSAVLVLSLYSSRYWPLLLPLLWSLSAPCAAAVAVTETLFFDSA